MPTFAVKLFSFLLWSSVTAYDCNLTDAPVPTKAPGAWTKFGCILSDVASYTYTATVNNPAGDRLTVYFSDGPACSATSYTDGIFRYYEESVGTFGGSTLTTITASGVPCANGPPCCLFVYCDNTFGFDCGGQTVTTVYTALPPSPSPTPSPTPNAFPPTACAINNQVVPTLPKNTGYQAFSCSAPSVINFEAAITINNPGEFYLAGYTTLGKYCAMNPRDAEFKFMVPFSPGSTGAGAYAQEITWNKIPCNGGPVTFADGSNAEYVNGAPCCMVLLCGYLNNFDCTGLTVSQAFSTASRTPSPSPSAAPGSSASPSSIPVPSQEPVLGSCDTAVGIPSPLSPGNYRGWQCDTPNIAGGSMDFVVSNPAGDRLTVIVTSGAYCSYSPLSPLMQVEQEVSSSTSPTISLKGVQCQQTPCCAFITCYNLLGYPCSKFWGDMLALLIVMLTPNTQ